MKRNTDPLDGVMDVPVDVWMDEYEFDLQGLNLVIDYRAPSEYLCTFMDDHWEWMTLHKDVEQVKDYWEYIKNNSENKDINSDIDCYKEWADVEAYAYDQEKESEKK